MRFHLVATVPAVGKFEFVVVLDKAHFPKPTAEDLKQTIAYGSTEKAQIHILQRFRDDVKESCLHFPPEWLEIKDRYQIVKGDISKYYRQREPLRLQITRKNQIAFALEDRFFLLKLSNEEWEDFNVVFNTVAEQIDTPPDEIESIIHEPIPGVEQKEFGKLTEQTWPDFRKDCLESGVILRIKKYTQYQLLFRSLKIDEKYLEPFHEHEISLEDHPNLIEEDIKTLIPKIGPRSRFRRYLQTLSKPVDI